MLKRFVDILFASAALVALSPLLLLVALSVRLKLGSPVLFHQIRPGLGGKPFRVVKFRTMLNVESDTDMNAEGDQRRLTPYGRWLRSCSLDELPELVNVLRGEMSLVGPRPLLMEYVPLYSPFEARRLEVRPGLTGWAQGNSVDWDQRFSMDVWYVDNHTLWLDLKILWLTVLTVLRRDGIDADANLTMRRFTGTPTDEHRPTPPGN